MKVGIIGANGRMGQEVANLLNSDEISGGVSRKTPDSEIKDIIKSSSVVVDFSTTESALKAARFCAKYKVPFVCGTTGFIENDLEELKKISQHTAILHANNFSIGIALMAQLIQESEKILDGFDISIIDRHHNKKKDSPSGTALFLVSQLNKSPQVVSLRVGGILGDHICSFTGNDEEITISHRSFNRRVFAEGAIKCARWLISQKNGFYSLKDYLNAKI